MKDTKNSNKYAFANNGLMLLAFYEAQNVTWTWYSQWHNRMVDYFRFFKCRWADALQFRRRVKNGIYFDFAYSRLFIYLSCQRTYLEFFHFRRNVIRNFQSM